jgi:hypothetical protein
MPYSISFSNLKKFYLCYCLSKYSLYPTQSPILTLLHFNCFHLHYCLSKYSLYPTLSPILTLLHFTCFHLYYQHYFTVSTILNSIFPFIFEKNLSALLFYIIFLVSNSVTKFNSSSFYLFSSSLSTLFHSL